jgi:hypothetical protein
MYVLRPPVQFYQNTDSHLWGPVQHRSEQPMSAMPLLMIWAAARPRLSGSGGQRVNAAWSTRSLIFSARGHSQSQDRRVGADDLWSLNSPQNIRPAATAIV